MKVGIIIFNSMFLLLFISIVIGEWGQAPAIVGGIGITSVVLNTVFIFLKIPNDFAEE